MHLIIDLATAVGAVVTACSAVWGTRKMIPFLRSQAEMSRENSSLRYERDEAVRRAELERQSAEAWQQRFASIEGTIAEMRSEFADKMARMERKQDVSVRYICELIVWGHDSKRNAPMPEPPEELQTDVQQALREHESAISGQGPGK